MFYLNGSEDQTGRFAPTSESQTAVIGPPLPTPRTKCKEVRLALQERMKQEVSARQTRAMRRALRTLVKYAHEASFSAPEELKSGQAALVADFIGLLTMDYIS